ncbi:hypothetical protein RI054_39g145200 [Pseudoscourfieldia marina]
MSTLTPEARDTAEREDCNGLMVLNQLWRQWGSPNLNNTIHALRELLSVKVEMHDKVVAAAGAMWEANEEKQISKREDREKKVVDVYKAWVVAISDSGVWPWTLGLHAAANNKDTSREITHFSSTKTGKNKGSTLTWACDMSGM